jgi:hypothetical protein
MKSYLWRTRLATEAQRHGENDRIPPAPGQEGLLETLARKIVERDLSAPAIIFLESTKPLNFIGCQALNFLEPLIQSVFTIKSYHEFTQFMENRSNIERLILRIEELEEARRHAGKEKDSHRETSDV